MDSQENVPLYQNDFLAALNEELNNIDLLKQLANLPRVEQMRRIKKKLKEYHKYRESKERKQEHKHKKRSEDCFFEERQLLVKYFSNFSSLALECYLDDEEYFMNTDIINAFAIVPIVPNILKTVTSLQNDNRSLSKGIVKQAIKVGKSRQL